MSSPARRETLGDFEERLEVHNGVVTPKETGRYEHSDAQSGIAFALRGPYQRRPGAGGPGGWWIATEAEVAYPGWTFLHDLAGWRRARIPVKPSGAPVRDVPDWACEILSRNRRHDAVTKFDVLGAAGVRHYWLIDLEARELLVHRHEETGWIRVGAFIAAEPGMRARIEPFDEVELEVPLLFGDDPAD